MKIPISITPDKMPEFLQYLRAEFNRLGGWRGNGQYSEGGIYVEQLDVALPVNDEEVFTIWTFTWNPDGALSPIEVEANDASSETWQGVANGLVMSALESTINAKKEKFFRRDTFAYMAPNLDGEYWISGWRLAPGIPEDVIDYLSEHIIFLDHWVEAVDRRQSMTNGMADADMTITLLSLFMNVGFYRIPTEKRWVYTGLNESKRFQLGYSSDTPYPTAMPRKGTECRLGQFVSIDRRDYGSSLVQDHLLHLPQDIRKLFRAFHALNATQQKVFFNATALYRTALVAGRHLPTVRLAYQVAAVDALIEGVNHGQQAFVTLVQQYNSQASNKLIEYLYGKVRSAHFHTGQFPLGDYEPIEIGPISGPQQLNKITLQMHAGTLLQPVLIDWLISNSNIDTS